jgi:parallel beta-helix repeat protein
MRASSRAQWCLLLVVGVVFTLAVGGTSQARAGSVLVVATNTTLTAEYAGQILVVGTGVSLDCAGNRVTGAGEPVGINVVASGVTVMNCQVQGFAVGIMTSADASRVLGNVVTDNDQGIRLAGGSGATVSGNRANRNRSWGIIAAQAATGATISDNSASSNGLIGIALNTVSGIVVTGNSANHNGGTGVDSLGSSSNQIRDNVAVNNGTTGFEFGSASNNTVSGNVANNNGTPGNGTGFNFNNSPGNTVSDNIAIHNGGVGFFVFFGSELNLFTLNRACANFYVDAADISTGAGNSWTNNEFCTGEVV